MRSFILISLCLILSGCLKIDDEEVIQKRAYVDDKLVGVWERFGKLPDNQEKQGKFYAVREEGACGPFPKCLAVTPLSTADTPISKGWPITSYFVSFDMGAHHFLHPLKTFRTTNKQPYDKSMGFPLGIGVIEGSFLYESNADQNTPTISVLGVDQCGIIPQSETTSVRITEIGTVITKLDNAAEAFIVKLAETSECRKQMLTLKRIKKDVTY